MPASCGRKTAARRVATWSTGSWPRRSWPRSPSRARRTRWKRSTMTPRERHGKAKHRSPDDRRPAPGSDAAPEDDAQHQHAPAVPRRHGAHVGASVGRRDVEHLVPGDRATDVKHDDALAAVGEAAHHRRPAVLPAAAGHAVPVLEARVPAVTLGPGRGETRERGEGAGAEFAAHGASLAPLLSPTPMVNNPAGGKKGFQGERAGAPEAQALLP